MWYVISIYMCIHNVNLQPALTFAFHLIRSSYSSQRKTRLLDFGTLTNHVQSSPMWAMRTKLIASSLVLAALSISTVLVNDRWFLAVARITRYIFGTCRPGKWSKHWKDTEVNRLHNSCHKNVLTDHTDAVLAVAVSPSCCMQRSSLF